MSGKYRTGLSRVETGAIGLRSLNVPSANVILITDTIHRFAHNWLQPSKFDFCRSIHSFNLSEVPVRPGVSASAYAQREVLHASIHGVNLALVLFSLTILRGCERLVPRDTQSLLIPRFTRSEVFGFVVGFGTTFAAMPDLLAMLRRRSSAGMNPRMAAIMVVFQILWIYYGLLILSRPVIVWNVIAVIINSLNVAAYFHFARRQRSRQQISGVTHSVCLGLARHL